MPPIYVKIVFLLLTQIKNKMKKNIASTPEINLLLSRKLPHDLILMVQEYIRKCPCCNRDLEEHEAVTDYFYYTFSCGICCKKYCYEATEVKTELCIICEAHVCSKHFCIDTKNGPVYKCCLDNDKYSYSRKRRPRKFLT